MRSKADEVVQQQWFLGRFVSKDYQYCLHGHTMVYQQDRLWQLLLGSRVHPCASPRHPHRQHSAQSECCVPLVLAAGSCAEPNQTPSTQLLQSLEEAVPRWPWH